MSNNNSQDVIPKNKKINPETYNAARKWLVRFQGIKNIAFAAIVTDKYSVGIAERGTQGYTPSGVVLPTVNYNEAKAIVDELNEDILGLDAEDAMLIVVETMRR